MVEASGDPTSAAWSVAGLNLADLYAANAAGHAAPEALAAIERAATAALDEAEGGQTAAQVMAAAAYALVARGQAERFGQLDLLK